MNKNVTSPNKYISHGFIYYSGMEYGMVCMVQYGMVWYVWYSMYGIIWYNMVWYECMVYV